MRSLIYTLIIIFTLSLNAQVGIGTVTPQGALDIVSTDNGLLIPRVSLTSLADNTTIATLTDSELVYHDGTNGVEAGFYSWNATLTTWIKFGGTGWLLDGNPSVTAASFMGSINNADVVFRRNGIESGRISTNNTAFGLGALNTNAGSTNTAIGVDAMRANTGQENTAIGHNALRNSTGSRFNTAIGYQALQSTVGASFTNCVAIGANALLSNTAIDNTAVGFNALQGNTSQLGNTAVGATALNNAGGSFNTAVGTGAGFVNGSNNTFLGYQAGTTSTSGNNNVIVGFQATVLGSTGSIAIGNLANAAFDNSIAIGNTASTSAANEIRLGNAAITSVTTSGVLSALSFLATGSGTPYADYVFEDYFDGVSKIKSDYKFNTLESAEAFVIKNGHLPGVKSYTEVMENGFKLDLTDATIVNLEKLEEQFLYITELNKKISTQENTIQTQNEKIKVLEARLERIEILLTEQKN